MSDETKDEGLVEVGSGLTIKNATWECPKGHRWEALYPGTTDWHGQKQYFCEQCYFDWLAKTFPCSEVTE